MWQRFKPFSYSCILSHVQFPSEADVQFSVTEDRQSVHYECFSVSFSQRLQTASLSLQFHPPNHRAATVCRHVAAPWPPSPTNSRTLATTACWKLSARATSPKSNWPDTHWPAERWEHHAESILKHKQVTLTGGLEVQIQSEVTETAHKHSLTLLKSQRRSITSRKQKRSSCFQTLSRNIVSCQQTLLTDAANSRC